MSKIHLSFAILLYVMQLFPLLGDTPPTTLPDINNQALLTNDVKSETGATKDESKSSNLLELKDLKKADSVAAIFLYLSDENNGTLSMFDEYSQIQLLRSVTDNLSDMSYENLTKILERLSEIANKTELSNTIKGKIKNNFLKIEKIALVQTYKKQKPVTLIADLLRTDPVREEISNIKDGEGLKNFLNQLLKKMVKKSRTYNSSNKKGYGISMSQLILGTYDINAKIAFAQMANITMPSNIASLYTGRKLENMALNEEQISGYIENVLARMKMVDSSAGSFLNNLDIISQDSIQYFMAILNSLTFKDNTKDVTRSILIKLPSEVSHLFAFDKVLLNDILKKMKRLLFDFERSIIAGSYGQMINTSVYLKLLSELICEKIKPCLMDIQVDEYKLRFEVLHQIRYYKQIERTPERLISFNEMTLEHNKTSLFWSCSTYLLDTILGKKYSKTRKQQASKEVVLHALSTSDLLVMANVISFLPTSQLNKFLKYKINGQLILKILNTKNSESAPLVADYILDYISSRNFILELRNINGQVLTSKDLISDLAVSVHETQEHDIEKTLSDKAAEIHNKRNNRDKE